MLRGRAVNCGWAWSDASVGTVILKQGRDKAVVQHHPWVFSGAIGRLEGELADGDTVEVCDAGGRWLARGYLNRRSQITVRLLTWDQDEPIDAAFWLRRLERALAARQACGRSAAGASGAAPEACRLAHAESDFVPGLVVDRYDGWLVTQCLTLGVDRWREVIVAALVELLQPRGVFERSDVDVRAKEGLEPRTGTLWGEEPPPLIEILESGHRFLVDVRHGHKTGFYLDQRENRARLAGYCAGRDVLDVFSYTGAFAVYAAAGEAARLTLVDSSAPALALARRHLDLNGFAHTEVEYAEGNAFSVLRSYRAQNRHFDVVVLDPPRLAASSREVERAARAYKDANLLAFQLLRPGGTLFTFSCSGSVSADLFQKIVFSAALDSGRDAQIVAYLAQGADHPVALTFPEGAYLKGLICHVAG